MIECIFTVDYEIYGNGEGSLRELVYEPAEKLKTIFGKRNSRFVIFVEAAELDKIEEFHADDAIADVRRQIQELHGQGIEIGLHIHPQWCNALYENSRWILDYSEYNLCILPRERIINIVRRSISYLRDVLGEPDFVPLSFRAGNWLLQPTGTIAAVLVEMGIKIDSSVFKGGVQHKYGLDYRSALTNGFHWRFQDCVNTHNPNGALIEIPTYTRMVPFWKMLTTKRIGLQRRPRSTSHSSLEKLYSLRDYLRLRYPLKFDFCRMTLEELIAMVDEIIKEDRECLTVYRPIVLIGHTKDLQDLDTVDSFLSYLEKMNIPIRTFQEIYPQRQSFA
jgi:hypothetical protein